MIEVRHICKSFGANRVLDDVSLSISTGETVVINSGFVQNTMQDRAQQDRVVTRLVTGEPVMLTGYIRFPETAGMLTPAENLAKRLWFTRDHLAMAQVLGWGEVAPFYIDLEQPVPPNGIPKPGPLQVHLKDDHLQYAITWFTLAGAVVIAFGVWLRGLGRTRKPRRPDGQGRQRRCRRVSALAASTRLSRE